MGWVKWARAIVSLPTGALLFALVPGCLDPTQMTVKISTNAVCVDLDETQVYVGSLANLDQRGPAATTSACDASGRIGDVVLVPGSDKRHSTSFAVVVGVNQSTTNCINNGFVGGCIVARRIVSFIPHRPLVLPVELQLECLDVPCSATQTCRNGQCVSAELDDPENCTDPLGCDSLGSGGSESGGSSGSGGAPAGGSASGGITSAGGSATGGSESSGGAGATGGTPATGGADTGSGGSGGTPTQVTTNHELTVTTTEDIVDGDTTSIDTLLLDPGADAAISLREALVATNNSINDVGADTIHFAISGSGAQTITPTSPLPAIVDAVFLDGLSQNGSQSIVISGAAAGSADGLVLAAGSAGSYVIGLIINGFSGTGLVVENAGTNTLLGNWIGVDASLSQAVPNDFGLVLINSANNTIGGIAVDSTQANVLSGNTEAGLRLYGTSCSGNVVQGNIIGLMPNGVTPVGNGRGLEMLAGAHHNSVGSDTSNRNTISANLTTGILIDGSGTSDNVFRGNHVGADTTFSSLDTLGNGQAGILIAAGASNNLIGSTDTAQGNKIVHNGGAGINIQGSSLQNAIIGNYLDNNAALGIDLGADQAVTPNDALDSDSGPNELMNFPTMTGTSYAAGSVSVNFTLDVPAGDYRIEFFTAAGPDSSGYGEGATLAQVQTVTHAGVGTQPFSTSFTMSSSDYLSATCTAVLGTSSYGSTSEFSLSVPTSFTP